jgi:hypothetical protein
MLSYPLDLRQKFARGRVLYEIPRIVLRLYPALQHLVFGATLRGGGRRDLPGLRPRGPLRAHLRRAVRIRGGGLRPP